MKTRWFLLTGLLLLASQPGWALGLTDVSNNIVTPNGDGFNDRVLFVVDNPTAASIDGRLYDVSGREVATLGLVSHGASTTLSWDGRDSSGSSVESGVYIFRINDDASHVAGMVAVAR